MASDEPSYYILRADARHEQDAKWVTAVCNPLIPAQLLSASRDRTAASWVVPPAGESGDDTLGQCLSFVGHTHYVNFVLYVDALGCTGGAPAIITGAHDKNVLIWNVESTALDGALVGHDDVVKCGTLLAGNSNILVTGSWDNSCIVWDLNQGVLARRVRPHKTNITGIAAFIDDQVLSTSGDQTVVRWSASTGQVLGVYKGHTDTVQSAVSLAASRLFCSAFGHEDLFASAGNDGNVLVWSASQPAEPVARFLGHESIVHHVACHPVTGELLTSGDDNTLRVWTPTACAQCIFHPDLVWSSTGFSDSEDIATACSDGFVRVWTRDVTKMATPEKIEVLDGTVAATRLAAKLALAGIDPSTIPDVATATAAPGAFEGQRTLGRDGDFIRAFAWGQGRWDRIGTIVRDGSDDGSNVTKKAVREKQYFDGQWYDYLLDVEIAGAQLKLPYNRGQSVFDAAQQFIYDYGEMGISQSDKELIQNHILNAIDPEDAALVGGGIGSGATPSAGGNYAFSAYAKELAELQAQGKAGQTGSYRDEYNKLMSAGGDVNFSTFAQEEAEAQARLAGASNAAAPMATSSQALLDRAVSSAAEDADMFVGFTAAGACKKLVEFGIPAEEADAATAAVAAASRPPAAALIHAVTSATGWITQGTLAPGQTFPVIDMLRATAVSSPAALINNVDSLATVTASALSTAASDVERTVALRLVTNLFGAAMVSDTEAALINCVTVVDHAKFATAYREAIVKAGARGAGATLKTAAQRSISAMALFITHTLHSAQPSSADLLSLTKLALASVSVLLIAETDNAAIRPLVRACLLLVGGAPNPSETQVAIRKIAAREIFNMVRSKKDYGDPDVVANCKHIYDLLLPLLDA